MEDLRRTYVSICKEEGVEPQEYVLGQLSELQDSTGRPRLNLSTHCLSVDTCAILGKVLQKEVLCTEVVLSDCMLSEEGVKLLIQGLCQNRNVRLLDLKGNNLRAASAEALGKLLRQNRTLQSLVLEWNGLGLWDEAFAVFCEGLRANQNLRQLDLRNNQISHQGAEGLAVALKHNNTLEELEQALQHNTECLSTLTESKKKTQILSNEIQFLKMEKGKQFLNLMGTIDRQREDINKSNRKSSIRIGQLQEALNERTSVLNSLRAKLQMTEAALALSEQKSNDLGELLTSSKLEKSEIAEKHAKELHYLHEEAGMQQAKLVRELNTANEKNLQLKNKVDELERKCKVQQDQIFELKQDLMSKTAELKLRLVQTEEQFEMEKKRFKQALEDAESLRMKEVEHMTHHLSESEKSLQERIQKLEGMRIQLEEEVSRGKAAALLERAQAEEEMVKMRKQLRMEEEQRMNQQEEKIRLLIQSRDESQVHCLQQKQCVLDLQAKNTQLILEVEGLKHRIEELYQELSGKEQEKVAEVNRARLELQEQIGHLQAERTAQEGFKEKIAALERQIKVQQNNHRESLLDKESEMSSLLEKLRLKDAEIKRMQEDEAQRANYLQNAVLAYMQGSPHRGISMSK
ncbi:leucine-rich repeat-containing protein 45 isoform X2 [Protopterus annectens]|uniref:leucine-rich repeat-containing protein 45 isoform X2 n=1 Tax=Protopterus annectens TaxID=7888 RepID=UPI001CFC0E54|nr:leucine-rich repeat-containing protein 45 isoform X2 [Protopterus annectens]